MIEGNEANNLAVPRDETRDELSDARLQEVIDDLDTAVAYLPEELTASVRIASNILVELCREAGWLLERAGEGRTLYLAADVTGFDWTPDSLQALRLARREDADSLAEIVEDCERIAEHQWG